VLTRLGFELTFSTEVTTFATTGTQTNPDRPSSINSWLANTTTPPATSPGPIRQSAQSPIRPLSPKASTREKQHNRLSLNFLKRGPSVASAQQQHNRQPSVTATEKAQEKENVRPATNGQDNGINGTNPGQQEQERVQSPTNLTTRSEDKLQKYFGIPHGQYRVMSPTHDDIAATTANVNENAYSAGGGGELERPGTRQSGVSVESSSHNRHGENVGVGTTRMGSVKKRLSLLGIGKKASKSSVRSRGQVESLMEE
jgi:hypothetical protein